MKILIFLMGFLLCKVYAADKAPEFVIEDVPSWVELAKEEEFSAVSDQESVSGVHYQLVDQQIKKETDEVCYFFHISKKVINQNGIDNAGILEIEYDPLCDLLSLHHVNVKRGKEVINHLKSGKIKVLQREKELERKQYTGAKSVNIILDDIRVGDVISYSFSLKNKNPNNNKRFYTKIYLFNIVPIHCMSKRILWPQGSSLSIKNHSTELQPSVKKYGEYTEYLWRKKDLPLDQSEPETPIWYDVDPWIEVGEYLKWHEINLSLSKHYKEQETLSPSLKEHIDRIANAEKNPAERFISAMRFIQDEIRYMGMSDRIDGYKPLDAGLTFSQRFGDCKDKTYLAITMLKALGIEAYPALVHTAYGKNLESRLPNPAIFNHIIVVAFIGSKKYWIDPTYSFQGGTLKDYVQPDYGYALILDGKSKSLTKMPAQELKIPSIEVYETFDISKGPEKPGYLTVKTIFKNHHADSQREDLQTAPKKELQKIYIKSYKKNYPSIRQKGELTFLDDREKNIITVIEEYEIPEQWEKKEESGKWFMHTYAEEFRTYISKHNIFTDRKAPVAVLFPRYILKKTELILTNEKWDLKPEIETVADPAFEFKKETKLEGLKFSISYTYKSLMDHIEPKMVASYIKNIDQAMNILGVDLYKFDDPLPPQEPKKEETLEKKIGQVFHVLEQKLHEYADPLPQELEKEEVLEKKDALNWSNFLLLSIALIFFTFMAFKIYAYQPSVPSNNYENPKLRGVKGWLLLLAIGVFVGPFVQIVGLWDIGSLVLSHNRWAEISSPNTDSFNPFSAPLVLWEAIVILSITVGRILCVALFLKRKRVFPRLFIYLLLGIFLYDVLDQILVYFIFSDAPLRSDIRALIRQALALLVWGTYMVRSKRVKATFTA